MLLAAGALVSAAFIGPGLAGQTPDSQSTPAPRVTADSVAPIGPSEAREPGARWRTSYFPYLTGGANDGPVLAVRVRYWQPAPYEARITTTRRSTRRGHRAQGQPLRDRVSSAPRGSGRTGA